MERGVYSAASGMLAQQSLQEILAQNVANATTVGYKQDTMTFRAAQNMALQRLSGASSRGVAIGEMGTGVSKDQTYIDWQSGPITTTNNPLDVSLAPGQFLSAQVGTRVLYTRAGNLQIDGTGNLVTSNGRNILDTQGRAINVKGRLNITIDGRGNVLSNQQPIARIQVIQADTTQLEKEGDTFYRATRANGVQAAANPQVRPGSLEQSNANVMQGLVHLITVSRSFEMAQRALTTQDELLRQATTEIGKV
jgi:flagellar basal-body rod protein FlgG